MSEYYENLLCVPLTKHNKKDKKKSVIKTSQMCFSLESIKIIYDITKQNFAEISSLLPYFAKKFQHLVDYIENTGEGKNFFKPTETTFRVNWNGEKKSSSEEFKKGFHYFAFQDKGTEDKQLKTLDEEKLLCILLQKTNLNPYLTKNFPHRKGKFDSTVFTKDLLRKIYKHPSQFFVQAKKTNKIRVVSTILLRQIESNGIISTSKMSDLINAYENEGKKQAGIKKLIESTLKSIICCTTTQLNRLKHINKKLLLEIVPGIEARRLIEDSQFHFLIEKISKDAPRNPMSPLAKRSQTVKLASGSPQH